MKILFLETGPETYLIGPAKTGQRNLGIPPGGAADPIAAMIANRLVGNSPETPLIESALLGPTLMTETDITACCFGAKFQIRCGEREIPVAQTFVWKSGEILKISHCQKYTRIYLAISGGIWEQEMTNVANQSPSLSLPIHLTPIQKNDHFFLHSSPVKPSSLRSLQAIASQELLEEAQIESPTIHLLPGLQNDWFDNNEFCQSRFQVHSASNRLGIRLTGTPIARPQREMVSEAITWGSVQITNEGLPIIVGVGGNTIGGYPKIGQVIQKDLYLLGQLRPHQLVQFKWVTIDQAWQMLELQQKKVKNWEIRLIA